MRTRGVQGSSYRSIPYGLLQRVAGLLRSGFFRGRTRPALYRGSILDDLLFAQPVNTPMRFLRQLGKWRRIGSSRVTVVIVNYNSLELIRTVLTAVRDFSPADTEVVILDNASTDGSWKWLKNRPLGSRTYRLPTNIGHGRALDLGVFLANSPIVVTLDSDAFPFSSRWLDVLLEPLSEPKIVASGSWGPRDRLHPACAAFKRPELLDLGLSFQNYNLHKDLDEEPVFAVNTWDTGELIYEALGTDRVFILPTVSSGRGWGTIMADVVYHHTGMTTGLTDDPKALLEKKAELWRQAVRDLISK